MKNSLCGIYCIENTIDHKRYIGMSRDIKRRWYEHKTELNHNEHNNYYLQNAWNKYGSNNFSFSVIELCDEEFLSEKECYYINLYKTKSHENGYNLTPGGEDITSGKTVINIKTNQIFDYVKDAAEYEGITSMTMIEWCRKMRNYSYLDIFNSLSKSEQEYWKNFDWNLYDHEKRSNAHFRENLSLETREKISKLCSGSKNPRAYAVYCPQLDETFECIKYASDKYGVNQGSIGQCILGKLKSAGKHPITGEKLTWVKVK